jgi:hypothetical protein
MRRHSGVGTRSIAGCHTVCLTASLLLRRRCQQPFRAAAAAARCRASQRHRCTLCSASGAQQSPEPTAGSSGAAKASSALATAVDAAAVAGPASSDDSAPPLQPGECLLNGQLQSQLQLHKHHGLEAYSCSSIAWYVCRQTSWHSDHRAGWREQPAGAALAGGHDAHLRPPGLGRPCIPHAGAPLLHVQLLRVCSMVV